jgi:hypothetical protein
MPLEAVRVPVKAVRVLWRTRVLLEVMIGIFEPKRLLLKAVFAFLKVVRVHVKSIRILVDGMKVLV